MEAFFQLKEARKSAQKRPNRRRREGGDTDSDEEEGEEGSRPKAAPGPVTDPLRSYRPRKLGVAPRLPPLTVGGSLVRRGGEGGGGDGGGTEREGDNGLGRTGGETVNGSSRKLRATQSVGKGAASDDSAAALSLAPFSRNASSSSSSINTSEPLSPSRRPLREAGDALGVAEGASLKVDPKGRLRSLKEKPIDTIEELHEDSDKDDKNDDSVFDEIDMVLKSNRINENKQSESRNQEGERTKMASKPLELGLGSLRSDGKFSKSKKGVGEKLSDLASNADRVSDAMSDKERRNRQRSSDDDDVKGASGRGKRNKQYYDDDVEVDDDGKESGRRRSKLILPPIGATKALVSRT
jgi:hypothetical protein